MRRDKRLDKLDSSISFEADTDDLKELLAVALRVAERGRRMSPTALRESLESLQDAVKDVLENCTRVD